MLFALYLINLIKKYSNVLVFAQKNKQTIITRLYLKYKTCKNTDTIKHAKKQRREKRPTQA